MMVILVVVSLSKRIKEVICELSGCADYPDCRGFDWLVLVVRFGCLVWLFGLIGWRLLVCDTHTEKVMSCQQRIRSAFGWDIRFETLT